ncbi:Carotenoid cleavage dioxygenase 8 [Monoraphidium neglectum]|uniref:Carotenoid cleavage dioxygenase 8 n=1 Tax=Monoraphidium neglectum TaxID=145388 RepID=A0A0D2M4C4_9CHLO|nr:Carotenoid cleavage dioxygenase 8 [Monoraphidium neglectum]KIY98414.1 Carotenoid cleavage dioxygenase 8 [Monoraphidium neglectum]|eukprot:XP_013897434.1 Carotenoid cleavage dioxygenase 8 [Monoraphidium neglectum]
MLLRPGTATPAAPALPATGDHVPTANARQALFGVAKEQVEEVPARVVGAIPKWLSGSLVVNGGGDYSQMTHLFDGYAQLVKARFKDGQAWGAQRYIDTEAYRAFKREGKVVYREFATPPATSSSLEALLSGLRDVVAVVTGATNTTDNASVSLHSVGPKGGRGRRQLLAVSETPKASYLIDPDTLATIGRGGAPAVDLQPAGRSHPKPPGPPRSRNLPLLPQASFPDKDPETLKRTEVAFVADRRPLTPAWLHDFPSTDDYAVIIEHPLYINLGSLLFGNPRPYVFMDWQPEDGTRITVVRLDGSEPQRVFDAPPFFVFHYGQCYEATAADGSRQLVVDMAAYDDPTILNDLGLQPLKEPQRQVSQSYYKRLTIPLSGPATSLPAPTPLAADPSANDFCEFPAINPAFRGRPYRYAYTLSAVRPTNMGNALSRIDVATGETLTWHQPGAAIGEPLFVAAPEAAAEDDGVVLAPGAAPNGGGFVVVLDAKTMAELGRVELPFEAPYRFHGIWLDGRE